MSPSAMLVYHHLDLLIKDEKMLYINIYQDWEFNFINKSTVASGMQTEVKNKNLANEEEDIAEMGSTDVVETLAAMVGKRRGDHI